ncbi:MerR family transcriptional regulator [uncultured Cocleimonas sp.]|uniref:MerR family transcriptional regulator n=1 Tax=uncultured Cocleimonas sp. TaxID=1051587 RepID=UPI0026080751|nr:MerR family transcriptional regulator [uncultured Cocleimonas sp.]
MTTSAAGYKIGKAAKMTGISTDKLRVWERRYAAVTPVRSDAGGRLYAYDDILRLKLIKKLIDGGDTISHVATLDLEELQSRVAEETQVGMHSFSDESLCIAVIGESLSTKFSSVNESKDDIEVVASYNNIASLGSEINIPKVDILIFERPALQEDNLQQILDLTHRFNASHTVIIYRFAAQDTLNRLPKSKCSALREPVDVNTIIDHCKSFYTSNTATKSFFDINDESDTGIVPARRYDDETLVKIAEMSPAVKCECPHHLAELLFSLTAFEKYSSECESLNVEDSELHAYLSNTTSKARHMIENALDKVIEFENIKI